MNFIKKLILSLALATSIGAAQQPQAFNGTPPFNADATTVNGGSYGGYYPKVGAGLSLNIGPGTAYCSTGNIVNYTGGTIGLTANSTNYIYLNISSSCVPMSNTSGFVSNEIPVATVITGSSSITLTCNASGISVGTGTNACIQDDRTVFTNPQASVTGVTSVSNSDGTLTISPTTGDTIASLNVNHANTWLMKQTQPAPVFSDLTGGGTQCLTVSNIGQVGVAGCASFGITALHGDGTATGPGDAAFTLATVNSTIGSCGDATDVCQMTTNGKGLVTHQAPVPISVTQNFTAYQIPPTSGQFVNLCSGTQAGTGSDPNQIFTTSACGGAVTASGGPIGAPHTAQITWSNYSLPSYVNPANVSAVYAAVTLKAEESGIASWTFECNSQPIALTFTSTSTRQFNALLSGITGSNINTVSCVVQASHSGGNAGTFVFVNATVQLFAFYTGTPPPVVNTVNINPPLNWDPSTNLLSLDVPPNVGADSGSANNYQVTMGSTPLFIPGLTIGFVPLNSSTTTTPTLIVQGVLSGTIENSRGGALVSGDISSSAVAYVTLGPDANWWLQNPQVTGASTGVTSVSNSDGTLTISPTTGAVVGGIALGHANTWTGKQSQPAPIFTDLTGGGTKVLEINNSGQASGAALAGSGSGIVTGPTTSANNDIVTYTGTAGQTADSGILITAIPAANIASGSLTNGMAATTQTGGDSTTKLATTAFVQAAIAAAGTGAGIVTYSGPSLTFSGTLYFPIGGGATASSTETNVDIDSPAAVTIQNMTVQMSTAPGVGNSVVYTWRKNASSQSLTCTISGASATSCSDTTHSFSTASLDLLDIQAVTTGTIVGTPTVVMAAQVGVAAPAVSVSSVSNSDGTLTISPTTGVVVAGLALGHANTWTGIQALGSSTATTQSALDNSTKLATTAYVDAAVAVPVSTVVDTGTPVTVSTTKPSEFHFNENATAATAVTYNLPTAAAGKQFCFSNASNATPAPNTGVLTIATSASGQFIIFTDGTLSATGGNITSGGAAADAACVVGADSTHWVLYVNRGTWTKH